MEHFQGLLYMFKRSFIHCHVVNMTVPLRVVLVYKNASFIPKTPSSKQKNCIANWFKKSEIEKDKKIEEKPLPIKK